LDFEKVSDKPENKTLECAPYLKTQNWGRRSGLMSEKVRLEFERHPEVEGENWYVITKEKKSQNKF